MIYKEENGEKYVVIKKFIGKETEVVIPDEIDALPVRLIGESAFWGREELTSVTFPEGLKTIGDYAFDGCTGLTFVTLPEGLAIGLGCGVFEYCTGVTKFVVVENNTQYKSVDGVLFTKNGLKLVAYPAGVSGAYTVPRGVKTIGERAFCGCKGLTSISLPEGLESIGNLTFYGCENLTIHAPAGSVAEEYAKIHKIRFKETKKNSQK